MTGSADRTGALAVGDRVVVEVGPVAHGGHCVARHGDGGAGDGGQVLFVRHTLPGERVVAQVTEVGPQGRFVRADAVEVHEASADRVEPPCPFSGPGRCGGCDWQHASLPAQRRLKEAVVAEQLDRLAGMTWPGLVCEPVPGDREGLGWRTRVEFAVAPDGALGLRAHRSHEVVPLDDCPIAHEGVLGTGVLDQTVRDGGAADPGTQRVVAVDVVAPSTGDPVLVPLALGKPAGHAKQRGRGRGQDRRAASRRGQRHTPAPTGPVPEVTERVGDHEFTLSARGFWQVHPGAAATFTAQVLEWLDPRPGERALDLYSGVGLFAVPLAEAVGEDGSVLAVEADRTATAAATRHLGPYPWAQAVAEPTERAVQRLVDAGEQVDLVVLDPPRSGAGRAVVEAVAALRPRTVVYVACDPAALARDLATAREAGLQLVDLRVLDAFPMTHHVECVALLVPGEPGAGLDTAG